MYHSCNLLFIIFTIAAAVSTSMSQFILFRFFMGCVYIPAHTLTLLIDTTSFWWCTSRTRGRNNCGFDSPRTTWDGDGCMGYGSNDWSLCRTCMRRPRVSRTNHALTSNSDHRRLLDNCEWMEMELLVCRHSCAYSSTMHHVVADSTRLAQLSSCRSS